MSITKIRDIEKYKKQEKINKECDEYHDKKTYKFDVYGQDRKQTQVVPSLLRPTPAKELNTRFIAIEAGTDRRIRISSMANRMHVKAPSIDEMRNTGEHTMLKKSNDVKYPLGNFY